eukprot:7360687-Pyramimonas_sp.AAC.1
MEDSVKAGKTLPAVNNLRKWFHGCLRDMEATPSFLHVQEVAAEPPAAARGGPAGAAQAGQPLREVGRPRRWRPAAQLPDAHRQEGRCG